MFKKLFTVVSLLIAFSMVLAACAPATTTTTVATVVVPQTQVVKETSVVKETQIVQVTAPPEPTATPAPSSRKGAWVDQLVFSEQNDASAAVKQIQAGDIDVYAYTVADPAVYTEVKADPKLTSVQSVGSYNELTFNPAGPTFADGRLNPFSNPKIREAMNMLVDRNYIVQEIYGGLAVPRFVPTSPFFADYARYIDTIRALEVKYAYNPEAAKTAIDTEMQGMGATLGADGKWQFNGAAVTLIAIIRTEDQRKQIGDYVCNQLETIGFAVDRQYKTRSEASPIWNQSDPAEGKMHFYTGGWISTAISRDDSTNFGYFYTPLGSGSPLWQAYKNDPAFYDGAGNGCADKLWVNAFASMDERKALWDACLPLALQDSVRLWFIDQTSFSPFNSDVSVSYDLAAGISGAQIYPYTIRFAGQEGGTIKIAQPGILVEPWNPVAGSNWIYDAMPQRASNEGGFMADPYTGLYWPLRAEKADVTVKEGLPVAKTLDWVTLTTAPSIEVPSTAWVDWNPTTQMFITAGEKYTSTQTTLSKVTVTYPADMFTTVTWHDGSPLSAGDFVMDMIMSFERGKTDSPNFDESAVPTLDAFLSHFKGLVIESTDPLVITTYDDLYYLDAEVMAYANSWYPAPPFYGFGSAPWQTIALGNLADASTDPATQLAWSTDKAGTKKVEWTSFLAGPSLDILKGYLATAATDNLIPFAPTMNTYVTADEATLRWKNLQTWYATQGHFWLGTGPFYVNKAFPVEKSLTLLRYGDYPDSASRWEIFGRPMIADVTVDGPAEVTIGQEATFNVSVTFDGAPYPADKLDAVKYLVFDANNAVVVSGDATAGAAGVYTVTLTAADSAKLTSGASKLEVVVTSLVVSIPKIVDFEFIAK